MRDDDEPDSRSEEDATAASRLARFGAVVGGGVLAAGLAAIPSALRVSGGGVALGVAWVVLAGASVLPATLLVAILRRASDGLRSLAGEAAAARAAGLVAWLALLLFFLVGFGALLRKKTHHHGLAGATFGIVALAVGVAFALLAARFAHALAARSLLLQRVSLAAMATMLLAGLVVLGSTLARAPGAGTSLGAWVVDGVALFVASTLASRTPLARVRPLALVGPPLAVVLLALAASVSRTRVEIRQPLHTRAPGYALLAGPLVP
ncbi:MAG: hypothetical protein JNL38_05435 [Myxococcales bacterium]|jgi:hypothetical protein|nr:hypothetical protein [Myxococcales bacterium]